MRLALVLLLTLTTLVVTSAEAQAETAVIPYCELIAHSAQYAGRVVVRATYKFTQDGFALFSNTCTHTRPALAVHAEKARDPVAEVAYQRATNKNPYAEVEVVIDGRLRKAGLMECIAITGGCFSYALDDAVIHKVIEAPQ